MRFLYLLLVCISSATFSQPSQSSLQSKEESKASLNGLYRMIRVSPIASRGIYIEYIAFFPNGFVFWRRPVEGLQHFDQDVACKAYPEDCGTYEIKGNEIHVLRGTSRKLYVITRNGERLINPPSLGKGSFRPVPFNDGLRLEGKYRRHESEPAIQFSANGTFVDQGIASRLGTRVKPDGTWYDDDGLGGQGKYNIQRNTLELQYTDGRIKRFNFMAFPEQLNKKPALDSFIINSEDTFSRF